MGVKSESVNEELDIKVDSIFKRGFYWVADNKDGKILASANTKAELMKDLKQAVKKGLVKFESVNEAQKSPAAKMVLQLMDKDPDGGGNYEVALKKALAKFKNVDKVELEKELDLYV